MVVFGRKGDGLLSDILGCFSVFPSAICDGGSALQPGSHHTAHWKIVIVSAPSGIISTWCRCIVDPNLYPRPEGSTDDTVGRIGGRSPE